MAERRPLIEGLKAPAPPVDLPRLDEVRIDWRVVVFAFALSIAAGVLCGVAAAWKASRSEPQDALRSGGRCSMPSRGHWLLCYGSNGDRFLVSVTPPNT